MKLFVGIYMLLGAYTASFLRDIHQHTTSDKLILAGISLACFIFAAIPIWLRKRQDGVLSGDSFVWPGLTCGMCFLGLALMWYYSSKA